MPGSPKKLIIGISGASGAIYGVALLKLLRQLKVETHLVVSKTAQLTLSCEMGLSLHDVAALADIHYNSQDMAAAISSGSFKTDGMIIAPCSMKSLGEIATATGSNLLTRAADVVLKERRRLVLMVRETPLHSVHLRHMLTLSDMGAIIAPPVPAFYNAPASIDDVVRHSVGRVLDLFDIAHENVTRWHGLEKPAARKGAVIKTPKA
jgi:4-hydroxy-3-polyprenylbenzoate decarboxylase